MKYLKTFESSNLNVDLHDAIAKDNIPKVKKLIENGADVNNRENHWRRSPLSSAAFCNQYEIAKMLLESGADVNGNDTPSNLPIFMSVMFNSAEKRIKVIKLLLSYNADINVKLYEKTLLYNFCRNTPDIERLNLFIENANLSISYNDVNFIEIILKCSDASEQVRELKKYIKTFEFQNKLCDIDNFNVLLIPSKILNKRIAKKHDLILAPIKYNI